MPGDPKQPLTTTIKPAGEPNVAGTTTAARAARAAQERPASEATLSIMPGAGDLARELGIKTGKFAAKKAPEGGADEGDDAGDDDDDDAPEGEAEEEASAAETDEEAEAGAGGGTDEEEAQPGEEEEQQQAEDELPPQAVAIREKMQKRIDKLTAKSTEAQEELEELRSQLAEAQAGPRPARTAANPLADVMSARDLESAVAEARQIKRFCTLNRDGGELPTGKDGETQAFDAQQVATMLANAEAVLDAVPERQHWLTQQSESEALAKQVAPVFFQKGTEHAQVLDKVWKDIPPAVKAWRPDAKLCVIQMLVGAAVMIEKNAAKGKQPEGKDKPRVSATKVPPAPGGKTAPKASAKVVDQRKRKEADQKVFKGGQRQLEAAIAARFNFK